MHRAAAPRVVVQNVGVDAALVEDESGPILVLSPEQSFENAVEVVSRLLTHLHPDAVRSLVREHIPESADFDAITGTTHPGRALPRRKPGVPRRTSRVRWPVAVAALCGASAALGVGLIAHQWGELSRMNDPEYEEVSFFEGGDMAAWEAATMLECNPTGAMTARCTDLLENRTLFMEAGLAPTSVLLWAIDGTDRTYVRVFASEAAAESYEVEDGKATHANFIRVGPYVAYGKDPELIGRLMAGVLAVAQDSDLPEQVSSLRVVDKIK